MYPGGQDVEVELLPVAQARKRLCLAGNLVEDGRAAQVDQEDDVPAEGRDAVKVKPNSVRFRWPGARARPRQGGTDQRQLNPSPGPGRGRTAADAE